MPELCFIHFVLHTPPSVPPPLSLLCLPFFLFTNLVCHAYYLLRASPAYHVSFVFDTVLHCTTRQCTVCSILPVNWCLWFLIDTVQYSSVQTNFSHLFTYLHVLSAQWCYNMFLDITPSSFTVTCLALHPHILVFLVFLFWYDYFIVFISGQLCVFVFDLLFILYYLSF